MLRAILLVCSGALFAGAASEQPDLPLVDFAREVRPILAEKCFGCHGPDDAQREGGLRLDTRDGLLAAREDYFIVVPGEKQSSELWHRITDEVDPMPPKDAGEALTEDELAAIKRWIEQGAEWSQHWSFEAPLRPDLPQIEQADWPRNGVDHFVLAELEAKGLKPSPELDKITLLRRLSFDLTGLPPTLEELDDFLGDPSQEAYEKAVDRLLESQRYGERQAQQWLDLARYADSNGDGYDGSREMWRWRQWVIQAFNANQPFDQFTTEQIAGDLIPDATRMQRLATGFHRNHAIFTKGGAKKDEYRHAYVVDRVNTTATVWMGLTMGCVQCHDHKYDPFSQKEYYQLYAYFNNVTERDVGRQGGNTPPYMVVPEEEDAKKIDELALEIAKLEAELEAAHPDWDSDQGVWEQEVAARVMPVEWKVVEPTGFLALGGAQLEMQEDGSIMATGPNPASETYHVIAKPGTQRITALRLEVLPHEGNAGRIGRSEKGTFYMRELEVYLSSVAGGTDRDRVRFLRGEDDLADERSVDGDKAVDGGGSGWAILRDEVHEPHEVVFYPEEPLELNDNAILRFVLDQSRGRRHRETIGRFRLSYTDDKKLLRHRMPVLPGVWHAVGPFAAEDEEKALAQVFEPEKEIATGVDLEAQYEPIELKKKERGEGGSDEGKQGQSKEGEKPSESKGEGAEKSKPGSPRDEGEPNKDDKKQGGKPAGMQGGGKSAKQGGEKQGGEKPDAAKPSEEPAVSKPTGKPGSIPIAEPEEEEEGGFGGGFGGNFDGGGGNQSRRRKTPKILTWDKKEEWRDGGRLSGQGSNSAWYMHRTLESDIARPARVLFETTSGMRVWVNGEQVFEREKKKAVRRDDTGYDEDFVEDDEEFSEMRRRRRPDYEGFDVKLEAGENHIVVKSVGGSRGASLRLRVQPLGRDSVPLAVERAVLRGLEPEFPDVIVETSGEPIPAGPYAGEDTDPLTDDAIYANYKKSLRERRSELARDWYRRNVRLDSGPQYVKLDGLRLDKRRVEAKAPTVMILDDGAPRETHILVRGAYDKLGEKVEKGVPSVLPPLPADAESNRLGLAKWLVSGEHPLTARVAVNNMWRQYFGSGLVSTANDFGTRGALPTHPMLLDWLATEFVEKKWDVKAMHKLIVMSATYRQDCQLSTELLEADPGNKLFTRGPRMRLTAEMVRDNALHASGLLVELIGGKSVKPYQPKGLWSAVFGNSRSSYKEDKGEKLYRRGLYVYWKRGVLYPSFAVFDAPTRATCASERVETNTPLQSLVLLNDPVFVEAARGLAVRMLNEGGVSKSARLTHGFRLCTSRTPSQNELAILLRVLGEQEAHYADKEDAAKELLKVGESKPPEELDARELAAWAAVASMLLNLDATIHRS